MTPESARIRLILLREGYHRTVKEDLDALDARLETAEALARTKNADYNMAVRVLEDAERRAEKLTQALRTVRVLSELPSNNPTACLTGIGKIAREALASVEGAGGAA